MQNKVRRFSLSAAALLGSFAYFEAAADPAAPPAPGGADVVAPAAAPAAKPAAIPAATPPTPTFQPGEKVHFKSPLTGLQEYGGSDDKNLCLPAGWGVWVNTDGNVNGVNTVTFSVNGAPSADDKYCGSVKQTVIQPTVIYTAKEQKFLSARYTTEELVSGALLIPFKFHISDHHLTAGETLGGYLGYRVSTPAFSLTPIVSAGLAVINSNPPQVSSGGSGTSTTSNSTSQTLTGFSAAVGLVGSIASTKAQIGFVGGADWAGKSAQYQYEGKPWISFEIGYNFLGSGQ